MKKLLLVIAIAFTSTAFGQIVNGNFELWSNTTWEDVDSVFQTSNGDMVANGGTANATKTTDKQHGSFALKLETTVLGGDTDFAYVLWGQFGDDGPEGGVPFTQKPDSIVGYYKSSLPVGDTALALVVFWQNDTARSMEVFPFTGNQSTYARFAFELNIPTSTVDSVTLGFTSGNAFNDNAPKTPGSWIQIDNISFSGTGITQNVPNPSFESWVNRTVENPNAWYSYNTQLVAWLGAGNEYVKKSATAYKGSYACEITHLWADSNSFANISNAWENDNGDPVGGTPFTNQVDTLCGWYKYIVNAGLDTGIVNLSFEKNDTTFDWAGMYLEEDTNWTYFEIPFNLSKAPDTVIIDIAATNYNGTAGVGNVLLIDELQFKSSPVYTGLANKDRSLFSSRLYPNPARDFARIEYSVSDFSSNVTLEIYDISGKQVFTKVYAGLTNSKNIVHLNTSSFAQGLYTYKLTNGLTSVSVGRFVVE